MPRIISSKIQILILSSIGVYRTIKEFYDQNLEEVWQLQLCDSLSSYQNLIMSVISGIILVREFTGHLYIATYFLILYPILMGKMRSVLLLWMFVSGMRSILLNLGVAIIGLILCSTRQEFSIACFKFVAGEALELGCSIYLWTVVNDYYHSLKRGSPRNHMQSPLSSPISSGQSVEETSSSFLSDEWSLPSSLVEEFQKNTKENLLESVTKTTTSDSGKNLKSRSVDSLLAQAMVDWFLKKIVKFKPKGDHETSSPSKLTDMNSNDIAALRKRIKKSIADVDENEIKDLLVSENSEKKNRDEISNNINEFEGEKIERVVTHDDLDVKTLNERQFGEFSNKNIEEQAGGEDEKMPDLINDINKSHLDIGNYFVKTELIDNPFEKELRPSSSLKHDNLSVQPLNAVNFVKQLFEDSIENSLDKTVRKKSLDSKIVRLEESVIEITDELSAKDLIESCHGSSYDVNEKALDCSIAIVKSILEDIIKNAVETENEIVKLKELNRLKDTENLVKPIRFVRYNDNKLIKTPLKESNTNEFTARRRRLTRAISFFDKEETCISKKIPQFKFNIDSKIRSNFDDFPESVRSVLKTVNMERLSKKKEKSWKPKKPYDKENLFEYTKIKSDRPKDESEMSVKSLRYHFRRTNQSKVPIQKRQRDPVINPKSLKALIDGIKNQEIKKAQLQDQCETLKKTENRLTFNDRLNHFKNSYAQTISNKQLLMKISEAEHKNASINETTENN